MKIYKLFSFVVAFCLLSTAAFASNPDSQYYFYGIDFSHMKVYGAAEPEVDFERSVGGINMLFKIEPNKYNVSKMFKQKYELCIDYMIEYNKSADFSNIKVSTPSIEMLNIDEIIAAYELPHKSGKGAIIITRMLNKAGEVGIFNIVVFDVETRVIERCVTVEGEPGGYGLRNYWASSVCEILRNSRIY